MSDNYGVLRVVHVRPPTDDTSKHGKKRAINWAAEERMVHLLNRRQTTIGRALSNDLILMDPAVSRNHARLVLGNDGWIVYNITEQNSIQVNDQPVPNGACIHLHPQDFLLIGNTLLQLVAPQSSQIVQEPDQASTLAQQEALIVRKLQDHNQKKSRETAQRWLTLTSLHNTPTELPSLTTIVHTDEVQDDPIESEVTLKFALLSRLKHRMRWLFIAIALLVTVMGTLVTLILSNTLVISPFTQEGSLNFFLIFFLPLIPAFGINLLVSFMDRFEREPWFLRLSAFLWGGIIAIPPTFFLEQYIFDRRMFILGTHPSKALEALFNGLNAGIIEESAKGLGLLLLFIFLYDEYDNVTDGIVYGALIGAGFALVENFLYFAENPKSFVFLIIGRIVLNWLCHSTFIVCFGIALGYVRHTQNRLHKIIIPIIGYLTAIILHTIFDFIYFLSNSLIVTYPDNPTIVNFAVAASIANYIPPFIAQMLILYCLIKSLAHEGAIIREYLAPEVSTGVVSVDEYALLQHSFLRTRVERAVLLRYGLKQWLRVKKLYQLEIGLAFRKWHLTMGDKPKPGLLQPEDAYRKHILRLRHTIFTKES